MKTFKALFIDNGVIKAGEFPEWPEYCQGYLIGLPCKLTTCKCVEQDRTYYQLLATAKANAVECEDQQEAKEIIAYELFNGPVVDVPLSRFNEKIIPLPPGWDYRVEQVLGTVIDLQHEDLKRQTLQTVSKLCRTDEQTKIEELRKKLDAFLSTQTKEQLEKWLEMDSERMKQSEPEERQDKLWMNVIILVGQNIDRQGPSKIIQQLEERFTITRRKS